MAKAIGPRDIIDWLLIKDVVALTWEIQRGRRYRESLMRLRKRDALEKVLMRLLPPQEDTFLLNQISEGAQLARRWSEGDEIAVKKVETVFGKAGISMADVAAQALSDHADEFERIEAQAGRCEDRRDKLLLQIERRRSGSGQAVLKASETVIDAEFESLPPRRSTASVG